MDKMSRFKAGSRAAKHRCHKKNRGSGEPDPSRLEQLREDLTFFIHEIRTPLTAIISSAEILKRHRPSAKERNFLLDTIQKEGLRIDSLLRDFFTTCRRDETWLSSLNRVAVPAHDLLRDAAERFRNLRPPYWLRIDPAVSTLSVSADREKIELVLRNLLGNAIKYSPRGGTIVLSVRVEGAEAIFCVEDEGVGIPEDSLEKIFEKTFRGDRPKGDEVPGAGLGLAIVRQIVENHGGRIWAANRRTGGSSFFFSLPLHPAG